MAVMKQTRMMRDERGGKPLGVKAEAGMKVEIVDDTQLPWTKIRLAAGERTEGWVSDDAIDKTADTLGPLDHRGWGALWSRTGMQGWPAREILEACLDQHPTMSALVPIDILGMVTDRNPSELYW